MNRRSLLIGLGSALLAPAIVRASSLMPLREYVPILWGDGIHDDSDGLQACLDRKPYRWNGLIQRSLDGDTVAVPSAAYRTTRTIIVRKRALIRDSRFIHDFSGEAMMVFEPHGDGSVVENSMFTAGVGQRHEQCLLFNATARSHEAA